MRSDGRQPLEAREFDIETNILVQCWGSARCVVGGGLGGGGVAQRGISTLPLDSRLLQFECELAGSAWLVPGLAWGHCEG